MVHYDQTGLILEQYQQVLNGAYHHPERFVRASGPGRWSAELRDALEPLLEEIESLNERIDEYDRRIAQIAKEVYPEVALLKQVKGVGTLIALTYVLTLDESAPLSPKPGCGMFSRAASWPQELW